MVSSEKVFKLQHHKIIDVRSQKCNTMFMEQTKRVVGGRKRMDTKKSGLREFTRQYQVCKTVKFALTPVGQTEKHISDMLYQESARRKDQAYKIVKPIIDAKFQTLIDTVLEQCTKQDWSSLEEKVRTYQKDKSEENRNALERFQDEIRAHIAKEFENSYDYKLLFGKDGKNLFKKILPEHLKEINADQKELDAVKEFADFKTYFDSFLLLRKDIFSKDAKQNTIAYRVVNENFMIFLGNKKIFDSIQRLIPIAISEIEQDRKGEREWEYYQIENAAKWFETENFQMCLSQWGIQRYNYVIGLVNAFVNQYLQQHAKDIDVKYSRLRLRMLHKQILSDRQKPSWLPEQFADGPEGEKQIYKAVEAFEESLRSQQFEEKYTLLLQSELSDSEQIYFAGSALSRVSVSMQYGWNGLYDVRKTVLEERIGKGKRDSVEKNIKQDISLAELKELLERYACMYPDENVPSVQNYIEYGNRILENCKAAGQEYHRERSRNTVCLNENDRLIDAMKNYLDAFQEILHYLGTFVTTDDLDKNAEFYSQLDELLELISEITPLYNKVRNYVTRKNYSLDKMRIMFEKSDFLSGWGQKFDTKEALIFKKEDLYYIGILEKKYKNQEVAYLYEDIKEENRAVRFIYNFQKVDNKNVPRVFIRSKGDRYAPAVQKYQLPIDSIIEIYDKGKYKTEYKKVNEEEYYESLEKLIDYFKEGFTKHESYKNFTFTWKPSNAYENIAEFYKDTNDKCFLLEQEEINFQHLLEQADQGKIYLFQVSSKDFSKNSKGTPNLQTMYWRELFSEENRQNGTIKLMGGASIYMRDASIQNPIVHKKGTDLINRWYVEAGKSKEIPNDTYVKFSKILQGRMDEKELGQEELALWRSGLIQIKKATHDIVKDRRYTKRQYMLHAPLMLNYQQAEKQPDFNSKVRAFLKNNQDVNIIGIDRGERNLLYITIIDRQGNILPETQRSFNLIEHQSQYTKVIDYHEKLRGLEERRDESRKSWKQIGTIKELKEGYLSQVVHEITQLMIQYNAILVMEDLNMGFKKGRMRVERNVYQKFEKMLIDKLNYLAFKRTPDGQPVNPYETGGVMNAYQLTEKFVSFKDMNKQNGFLFYVRAAYTSAIDPVTGFVDVFSKKELKSLEGKHQFLRCFDEISWDEKEQSFVFVFDYEKFKCVESSYRKKWSLYADVDRIETKFADGKVCAQMRCNPNQKLIRLMDEKKIVYRDGRNLVQTLESYDNEIIREMTYCFQLILHLRNSMEDHQTGERIDEIVSPVMYQGEKFRSNPANPQLPIDADANGAYHIALKGLMCLQRIDQYADEEGRMKWTDLDIKHEDWFRFMQTRNM